jgi:hypothetical protein
MINLIDEFREELIPGSYLVVMPISRFEIETQFKIGPFRFYPSDTVDIKALRPIRNCYRRIIIDPGSPERK